MKGRPTFCRPIFVNPLRTQGGNDTARIWQTSCFLFSFFFPPFIRCVVLHTLTKLKSKKESLESSVWLTAFNYFNANETLFRRVNVLHEDLFSPLNFVSFFPLFSCS